MWDVGYGMWDKQFKIQNSKLKIYKPEWMVAGLVVIFALFFALLSVQQHRAFLTNGLDLGNVDQALWNTAHGRFLEFSLMTPIRSRLALHVEPILLAFVPFYWLKLGSPELLLAVQATVAALGAWPLYRIARLKLGTGGNSRLDWLLLVFPLAYLLYPPLESAVLFDFHAVTLAPTFFLFALLALEQKQTGRFVLFLVLAMACKEDMPLVAAMIGLYAGLAHRRWRLAVGVAALAAVWFGVAVLVVQPRFAAGGNIQLDRYAWLGASLPEMVLTLLTRPARVVDHLWNQADLPGYLARLLFPTAFLALFSPLSLLPTLPALAVNLLSDNPFTWRLEDFHYAAPLAPFVFVSAIYGIHYLASRIPNSASRTPFRSALLLLLLTFSGVYHFHRGFTPLARPFDWPVRTAHHRQLAAILETIPPDTAVFAQSNLAPHLTHRRRLYSDFAYFTGPDFPGLPVDDILLDVTAFENIGGLHQFLRGVLLDSGQYRLVTARDGILHVRPTTDDEGPTTGDQRLTLPPAFYTFTRPDPPPQVSLTVDFGDMLRLRGYSLHFNRQEEVQVSVDLEPLQPLDDIQPVLYLLDEAGQPVGATVDAQPALVWYPPEQWPAGQVVRVRFNTLPWYTRQTDRYRLALGVIRGGDAWDVGARLRPAVRRSDIVAPRLPADGTLLELARIEQLWRIPRGGPVQRQFSAPAQPHPLKASFDNRINLLGYSLSGGKSTLSLTLTWQAVDVLPRLTRFVQLVGPDGQVYAQNDAWPDGGLYPTDLWLAGEVVRETVTLSVPDDLPSGAYTLHIGLYPPDTGRRLPLASGADHIEVRVEGVRKE